ncbi:MAG: DUF3800 domain-containing protein [Planctomycetia bacterium]|nr:DUF3800 domain-containing protein [Planctomycetia bacterium]
MLLFIDESGHNESGTPCEVLAGVAIAEDALWNLVRAIRSVEKEHFGDYLRNLLSGEIKGRRLLKRKRFKIAKRSVAIAPDDSKRLANSLLVKGKAARDEGLASSGETLSEMVAYSREVLAFVHDVLDIAASYSVQVFASVTDPRSPRPGAGQLRKDYVYLFERYFYFLETLPPRDRGLIVFDELEKSQSHILVQQMAAYFLGTETGRYRSSRIVPEPFFVHSDLTTGVFLADLAAYIIGWGWRTSRMTQPARQELRPYATKLHDMQFHGDKPKAGGEGVWQLHGIVYMDDLRGRADRIEEEGDG